MASKTYHCKDCDLYFDSPQSLDVHFQYHKENLLSMWMGTEEIKKDIEVDGSSLAQMNRSSTSNSLAISSSEFGDNMFSRHKENVDLAPLSSFLGPSPISPMDYDFKVEPSIASPQECLVSQGPPSGSGMINYSQLSPSGYYQDFNQLQQIHPATYNNFSSTFVNESYDDQFYNRQIAPSSRFHPYGCSPVPTPSPGTSVTEMKEERLTPSTPEILDLDSHKVLSSNVAQNHLEPLPPMWRPHENFPSPNNPTSAVSNTPALRPSPSSIRSSSGLENSPTGCGPSPVGLVSSPKGLGPSPTGMRSSPTGLRRSPTGLGPSPIGMGLSTELEPSPTRLRPSSMGMESSLMGQEPSLTDLKPSPIGLGPSPTGLNSSSTLLESSSSGLGPPLSGMGQSPTGLGIPSTANIGPLQTGFDHSPLLAPSSSELGSTTLGPMLSGLGLTPGLNVNLMELGTSHPMPPPQQSVYGNQHAISQNHQIISSLNNSCFSSNGLVTSYYPQSSSVNSRIANSSVQFASTPTQSSSPREASLTEYPSNVKRAKSFKCEDCNKWFTSHGHLKRHYNTTLHKNMKKLNENDANTTTQSSTTSDITRSPILSPSSINIGENSTASNHEEESNLSTTDPLESTPNNFQPVGSAFQPPPVNVPNYLSHSSPFSGPSSTINHINTTHPHYNQTHSFSPEQPLTAPTMYHGHFSTNPTYTPQPPVTGNSFFVSNNYMYHAQQGGLHGPGFHSMNEYPGPSPVESLNSFGLESERIPHQCNTGSELAPTRISPEPSGDTGSEASMDSSESSSTGAVDNNYKCNDCNKTFNRMCYLTQHRSTYHEGEKPFKCGICGKRFTDEVIFTDHQGKHAGEKPYKCEVCPKQFNHKTDLRRHMCLHTGEKPFSCEQCGKGFIRKDHMLKHFQTHRKKALAATAAHPSMPQNPSSFAAHPGLHPPTRGSLPHPSHGSNGHPHVVAPTVY